MKKLFSIVLFSTLLYTVVYAQDIPYELGDIITVTLNNEQEVSGEVVSINDQFLVLLSKGDKISIPLKNIAFYSSGISNSNIQTEKLEEEYGRDIYRYYPDQYFLMPSARPVNKGEIYYRNIMIFGHVFSFGISDNFSLNAGFETLTLFTGETPVVFLTPKFSIPFQENINFGVGATGFFHEQTSGAFLFSNVTLGTKKNHFSIGVGFGSTFDEISEEPIIYSGWNMAISDKVAWTGEAFFTPLIDDDFDSILLDTSIRIRFKSNLSIDFGAFIAPGDGGVPILGITIPISDKN